MVKTGHGREGKRGAYGGHHLSHVAQVRRLSVRSGTTSFSATTYSYRETSTSLMLSGTVGEEKDRLIPRVMGGSRVRGARTVSDAGGLDDLEFLPDPRVEQTLEIKSVWPFLPAREVRDFIPVDHVALCAQLAEVADLGVNSRQEQATVRDGAVAHVAGAIIPCEAHAGEGPVAIAVFIERGCAGGGQELHNPGDGVRGAVANRPTGGAINVVCEKSTCMSKRRREVG